MRTLQAGRFFGHPTRHVTADGIQVVESDYPAGLRIPRHAHKHAHFCIVVAGTYDETVGRRATVVREPNCLMYYPPEFDHAEHHRIPGRHVLIELEPARLHSIENRSHALREPHDLRHDISADFADRMRYELRSPDPVSPLVIEGLVLELLANVMLGTGRVRKTRPPRWLNDVRRLLEVNFRGNLTLADVGETVSVHPVHVARVFRRHHLCSVGEFVRRLRVQYACRRIAKSSEPLAQIAAEAGFADQAHLCRLVRRHLRVSPSQLRGDDRG